MQTDAPPHELISAAKVGGTKVYAADGDHLGCVKTLMLHKRTGEVACAVLSFGGVLGIGEKYHPIPWSVLKYDVERQGYVIPYDKQTLKNAPSFSEPELESDDAAWREPVFGYYGREGYWR